MNNSAIQMVQCPRNSNNNILHLLSPYVADAVLSAGFINCHNNPVKEINDCPHFRDKIYSGKRS